MIEWEKIEHTTYRMPVPGGWLVRVHNSMYGIHMVFVKDLLHEWKIDTAENSGEKNEL